MQNIDTTSERNTRDIVEQVVGAGLVLGGVYKLARNTYAFSLLMYNYRKYLQIDPRKKRKIAGLVANPSLKEVVILDIFCNVNKQTFKYHFKEFNESDDKHTSTYSYLHPCDSFEASAIEDNKKYKMICKPRYMNSIYMTSTLIANMKALEKGSNNKPFTAIAYGELQYSRQLKSLLFLVSSLTISKEQKNEIWHLGFTLKSSIQFFLIGIFLGSGLALANHHKSQFQSYYQSIRKGLQKENL